ncbi:hypothetical protein E9993_20745 [Labilibacter sediminis]|nr:hypothetical protein E9993_20745 [Labilibacter sediminis]
MKFLVLTILLFLALDITAQDKEITGIVFVDKNMDGLFNKGDKPLKGVAVSNQREVVLTDKKGRYTLPLLENKFVYLVKPSNYQVKLNDQYLPESHYHYHPKGSLSNLKYKGVEATGVAPKRIDFPVYPSKETKPFKLLAIGDPQTPNDETLNYFRDGSVNDMIRHHADLYIALGDIADDNLNIYKRHKEIMSTLKIPGYHVPGNHDMNYRSPDNISKNETFKKEYGPDYYSFNYGKVHFIILNNIHYQGWNYEKSKRGKYTCGIDKAQLKWLKNDLELVSDDKLVVVNSHIPFIEHFADKEVIKQLHDLLKSKRKVLTLSGHTHTVNTYWNNAESYWNYDTPHEGVITGASCGSWYTKPKNENGIPVSTCMDGSPKGYFLFEFSGIHYKYKFIPVHYSDEFQIRISTPLGNIKKEDLSNSWIVANWFTGKPDQKVYATIDNGEKLEMENFTGKDPFMEATIDLRKSHKSWSPKTAETNHLWRCKIPDNLSPGCYRITVTAITEDGTKFQSFKIIEISE